MTHPVSNRVLKYKVFTSPRPYNMKETPVLDGYIKDLLLQKRKNLTVDH